MKGEAQLSEMRLGVGTRVGGLRSKQTTNMWVSMGTAFPGLSWRLLWAVSGGHPPGAPSPPAVVSSCFVTMATVTSVLPGSLAEPEIRYKLQLRRGVE